jgi:hypothetical protein
MVTVSGEQLAQGDTVLNLNTGTCYRVTGRAHGTIWMRKVSVEGNLRGPFIGYNENKHTRKVN